jgi:hypothetical protein
LNETAGSARPREAGCDQAVQRLFGIQVIETNRFIPQNAKIAERGINWERGRFAGSRRALVEMLSFAAGIPALEHSELQ